MMFNVLTYSSANQSIIFMKLCFTSSKSSISDVIGRYSGPTWAPVTSSTPPLMAYNSVLAKLARAPKNCMSFPTTVPDTQQAIAQSSEPHCSRS